MMSLVTVCHHTKLVLYYQFYSFCCTIQPRDIYNWKLGPLNPLHLLCLFPHSHSFWQPPVSTLYLRVCFCFVWFLRFHMQVKSYSIFLCLAYVTYFTFRSIHFVANANGKILRDQSVLVVWKRQGNKGATCLLLPIPSLPLTRIFFSSTQI